MDHLAEPTDPALVWICRTDRSEASVLVALERGLDQRETARAAEIRARERRDGYVVTHALARHAVAVAEGWRPQEVRWEYRCGYCGSTDHGRPIIHGSSLNISLSRTRGFAAVALGPMALGFDVEGVDLGIDWVESREVALTAAELTSICSTDSSLVAHRGCSLWVRKEAVLKLLGVGLARSPDTFEVIDPGPPAELPKNRQGSHGDHFRATDAAGSVLAQIRDLHFDLGSDICAAIATIGPCPPVSVRMATCAELVGALG